MSHDDRRERESRSLPSAGGLENAIAQMGAGRMVLLYDDCGPTLQGDLLIAAEFATAQTINFMVTEARGIPSLVLTPERCEELGLEQIERRGNETALGDSAMVSIEAREGVTTGISAADRARTIAVAIDPASGPDDLVQPGHIFPLRARPGGVIERAGRFEAAVGLAQDAGLRGAAVLCQVMRDDGHMARWEDLGAFAERHRLAVVGISQVVEHRLALESHTAAKPSTSALNA